MNTLYQNLKTATQIYYNILYNKENSIVDIEQIIDLLKLQCKSEINLLGAFTNDYILADIYEKSFGVQYNQEPIENGAVDSTWLKECLYNKYIKQKDSFGQRYDLTDSERDKLTSDIERFVEQSNAIYNNANSN